MSNKKNLELVDKDGKQMNATEATQEEDSNTEPQISQEQVKKEFVPASDMIAFFPPEETESGIILPEGVTLMDEKEYRPRAEMVGENVDFIEPGDRMVLHQQASQSAIKVQYKGQEIMLIHHEFVMGKQKGQADDKDS